MRFPNVFYHKITSWIRRPLARVYRHVVPPRLSADQVDFVERNAAFWRYYWKEGETRKSAGYVLVPVEGHPIIRSCDASFASIVAQAKTLTILFISKSSSNSVDTRILKSYPGATFVYLNSWRYVVMMLIARVAAAHAYRSIKTPQELLEFRVDGIRFGDVIYDAVLAGGYATIDVVDHRVLGALQEFYFFRFVIKDIMKRYSIRTSVFAHTVGLRGATFSRYLLDKKIEVLNRAGSYQIVVKKYLSSDDVGVHRAKPEPRYFQMMMGKDDGSLIQLAEEYLERRFNNESGDRDSDLAFNPQKETFTDRQSFCGEYHLDHTKLMIFVMLHAFNDQPHSHFAKPMLFQDYYWWFRRTLEIAQQTPEVNWVFKEHPAASYYVTKDVDPHQLFAGVNDAHVRFLPATADFNARSIPHLAHAIVTCVGTAGLEYATCGIPCVLGGESWYSGLGFTSEPETPEAYEACLRQIGHLPGLTAEQVMLAKLAAYFCFCVMKSARYHLCPKFTDVQISEWNADLSARLWKEAAAHLAEAEHVHKLRGQVEELSHFIINPEWTQYVDLRQFPFLRGAVGATDLMAGHSLGPSGR